MEHNRTVVPYGLTFGILVVLNMLTAVIGAIMGGAAITASAESAVFMVGMTGMFTACIWAFFMQKVFVISGSFSFFLLYNLLFPMVYFWVSTGLFHLEKAHTSVLFAKVIFDIPFILAMNYLFDQGIGVEHIKTRAQ